MTGRESLEELIERYDAAVDRLDEKIREANSTTKALRQAEKDGRAAVKTIAEIIGSLVEAEVKPAIEALLGKLVMDMTEQVNAGREEAVAKIVASFDELAALLKGESEKQRAENPDTPTVPEAVETIARLKREGLWNS